MHRYDTDTERGWERGRHGRREFEGRRWEYPEYESGESWRGYEGRGAESRDFPRFDRRYESRFENQGYGDQGSWGQPYADEYRSQDWGRQSGRQPYGDRYNRGEYGGAGGREFQGDYFGQQTGFGQGRYYGQQGFYGQQGGYGYSQGGYGQFGTRGRFSGRGPKNYQRSDQRIQEEINDRLTEHPDIDATDVEVKVTNAEVTLTGAVDERHIKRLAEDIAESVGGVKQVHNQIRVHHESGAGTEQQRKTASSENQQQRELTGTGGSRR